MSALTPGSIFVTSRVGWHGKSFVLPEQTIAPPGTDLVLYHGGRVEHHYRQKGTLEQWLENIAHLCIGNSRLVFAIALAFAGFLLRDNSKLTAQIRCNGVVPFR